MRRGGAHILLVSATALAVLSLAFCVLLFLHWRRSEAAAEALSQMSRARTLLEVDFYMAERRYQTEALSDRDADGRGEYAPLGPLLASGLLAEPDRFVQRDGVLLNGPYAFHVLVPAAVSRIRRRPRAVACASATATSTAQRTVDEAERRFAVLAQPLPADTPLRVLAIGVEGVVRVAPADFRPDVARPAAIDEWRAWD